MEIKKYLTFILFLFIPIGVLGFEESAIIYNSTVVEEQQIALGVRKEGHRHRVERLRLVRCLWVRQRSGTARAR